MRDRGVRAHWSCGAGLRRCSSVCFRPVSGSERQKTKNVLLLRDWEQVCMLCLTRALALYDQDMLRVHSDCCVILSPTTTSKIGHPDKPSHHHGRSREAKGRGERHEAQKQIMKIKGQLSALKSALVFQVYMVCVTLCANLLCRMLKFGLFSAARSKRQILSDCTSQTQFNI